MKRHLPMQLKTKPRTPDHPQLQSLAWVARPGKTLPESTVSLLTKTDFADQRRNVVAIVGAASYLLVVVGSLALWGNESPWPILVAAVACCVLWGLLLNARNHEGAVDAIRHDLRVFSANTTVLAAVAELEEHREDLRAATAGLSRGARAESQHAFQVLVWWAADQPPARMPEVLDAAKALCGTARGGATSRDCLSLADAISHINHLAYFPNHTTHSTSPAPSAIKVVDGAQR